MQRRNLRTRPRRIARRHNPRRWAARNTDTYPEPTFYRENPLPPDTNGSSSSTADAELEFGRFRVLLRQRQLLADGVPVELGTRAFDLLMVLLDADGLLVPKEDLLTRVWAGIVVSEENLKVQVSALRKALGADREVIRTEVGRGYRFTGVLRSNTTTDAHQRPRDQSNASAKLYFHRFVDSRSAGFRFEMTCQSAPGRPGIATRNVCRTRRS